MSKNNKFLDIKNLNVEYHTDKGVVHAVNGVDLSIFKGESLGLVGETGAGKTTIALSIMRLLQSPPAKIASGIIEMEEKEDILQVEENEMKKIRGNKISMIFQDPMTALNPLETVGWQIEETIRIHNKDLSRVEPRKRAMNALEMVGIEAERFDEYPNQFSGGMKQRVVIAIALACRPDLIIADEPTTALDVTIQKQVLELMKDLQNELDTSILMITHDLGVVAEMCQRVAIIYAGEIVEIGDAVHIYDNTQHPYTKGLFASIPTIKSNEDRLTPIPGQMHDPLIVKEGCVFADRCQHRIDFCDSSKPILEEVEPGHYVRCFLKDKINS